MKQGGSQSLLLAGPTKQQCGCHVPCPDPTR